jgi:hypothetical protein
MIGQELILVTSRDCHLCTHGHDVLARLGLSASEIDVDSAEAQALAEAGVPLSFLPVLWDGRRVLAYGRLSEKRLKKKLRL